MIKVKPVLKTLFIISAIAIPFLQPLRAQNLYVVSNPKIYKQYVNSDSNYRMIELHTLIPNLVYDLRYATSQNFTGKKLYHQHKNTYLRAPAANALLNVEKELNTQKYGLKIFDAYRPYGITKKMWQLIQDERYVADPAKGSNHNRGLAVDVTIVDLMSKKELDMGTGFDNFTDTAHQTFKNLPATVLQHRAILKEAMEHEGFKPLETEWWHYSWPNNRNYDVLDLSFKQLSKNSKSKK